MVGNVKCVSGIFSVYQSREAKDFADAKNYPIGFEAIFTNDKTGRDFAARFDHAVKKCSGGAVLFKMDGVESDVARGIDCFFTSADVLRRVLNESLPDAAFFHQETEQVIPKLVLVEQAKKIQSEKSAAMQPMAVGGR